MSDELTEDLSIGSGGGPGLSPSDELALSDLRVRAAQIDEEGTMWNPDVHPKVPDTKEEPVTSRDGTKTVDMQRDTPMVDDVASFDLSDDDLHACDL